MCGFLDFAQRDFLETPDLLPTMAMKKHAHPGEQTADFAVSLPIYLSMFVKKGYKKGDAMWYLEIKIYIYIIKMVVSMGNTNEPFDFGLPHICSDKPYPNHQQFDPQTVGRVIPIGNWHPETTPRNQRDL